MVMVEMREGHFEPLYTAIIETPYSFKKEVFTTYYKYFFQESPRNKKPSKSTISRYDLTFNSKGKESDLV